MASNIRIGWDNLADAATITASSQVDTLPIERLQTRTIADIYRAGSGTAHLVADLGALRTVGYVGFLGHNMGSQGGADTWRVRLSTADSTGAAGDAHTEAAGTVGLYADTRTAMQRFEAEPFGRAHRFLAAPVSARYVRIDFAMAALPYVQGGRLVVMNPWEPSRGFSFGAAWDPDHGSRRLKTKGGQVYVDDGYFQRRLQFTLGAATQAEAFGQLEPLDMLAGMHGQVLVCLNTQSAYLDSVTLYGEVESRTPMEWADLPRFRRAYVVAESK